MNPLQSIVFAALVTFSMPALAQTGSPLPDDAPTAQGAEKSSLAPSARLLEPSDPAPPGSAGRRVPARALSIAAAASFFVTHVPSFAAVILYQHILNDPKWIVGKGPDAAVIAGALLEMLVAFGNIGSAISLYPVVKDENEALATGYVALRTLESAIIVSGVVSLLSMVAMRQQYAATGGDRTSLITQGKAAVAFHNETFAMGPGLTSGLNTVFIAALFGQSHLVPKWIAILGLIGGPLVVGSTVAVASGLMKQYDVGPALLAVPEFAWEVSLASWLAIRGFHVEPR